MFEENRNFLKLFFTELNKPPYPYSCHKDTNKIIFRTHFQSWNVLYKVYTEKCNEANNNSMVTIRLLLLLETCCINELLKCFARSACQQNAFTVIPLELLTFLLCYLLF